MKTSCLIVLAAWMGVAVVWADDAGDQTPAEEIGLFDRTGSAAAYIAVEENQTIYLWEGLPVGYLYGEAVYGFNGSHLGWFVNDVMYDLEGKRVGVTTGGIEPAKGSKQAKPSQGARETAHARPTLSSEWSGTALDDFLRAGRS